jgi:integrase
MGNPMGRNIFASRFIQLKKRLGLYDQDLHFHDIRAKAATDAANQGLNAQRLLGHKNRNQKDHYIKQRQIDKVTPLSLIKKDK